MEKEEIDFEQQVKSEQAELKKLVRETFPSLSRENEKYSAKLSLFKDLFNDPIMKKREQGKLLHPEDRQILVQLKKIFV